MHRQTIQNLRRMFQAEIDGQAALQRHRPQRNNSMPELHHWEALDGSCLTFRMAVPGGWLYRFVGEGLCFVPQPEIVGLQPSDFQKIGELQKISE